MAGRKRIRLGLAIILFVIVAIVYTRRAPVDQYAVGGGSVLRGGVDGQEPAALPKSEPAAAVRPIHVQDAKKEQVRLDVEATTSSKRAFAEATSTSHSSSAAAPTSTAAPDLKQPISDDDDDDETLYEYGEGRVEVEVHPTTSAIHWTKFPEHFPVSSTIQLPTGTPLPIPDIQYRGRKFEFGHADEDRLAAVKEAAEHAWQGYREVAFGADEVKPISGGINNPFNGWGATLVDSLDTLWIMGMTSDFDEAVEAVGDIDFTTSARSDIPLFEVTIRYLGGLLAAYDISGQKARYRILLDKAVELGEVLYAAFDTPNRMPMLYYRWKPSFASQPHRASSRVVMAELGSLSMEFTKLAQLTGEPKYYDAVARLTDSLEEFQNRTRIPGMWPTSLDASGCAKPAQMHAGSPVGSGSGLRGGQQVVPGGSNGMMQAGAPTRQDGDELNEAEKASRARKQHNAAQAELELDKKLTQPNGGRLTADDDALGDETGGGRSKEKFLSNLGSSKRRRSLDVPALQGLSEEEKTELVPASASNATAHKPDVRTSRTNSRETFDGDEICEDSGLHSVGKYSSETFTLGGQSDSTYEYLPKEYLLLGGLVDQYRTMYIDSMEAVKQDLLFRPMAIDDPDVLISGQVRVSVNYTTGEFIRAFEPAGEHLTCFAGGMFALGGAIFDRSEDIDIGRKLTDGCIWAYNSTTTGIMPEGFTAAKCPGSWNDEATGCKWNETEYWRLLDPNEEMRTRVPTPAKAYGVPPATAASSRSTAAAAAGDDATSPPQVRTGLHAAELDDAAMEEDLATTPVPAGKAKTPVGPLAKGAIETDGSERPVYKRDLDEPTAVRPKRLGPGSEDLAPEPKAAVRPKRLGPGSEDIVPELKEPSRVGTAQHAKPARPDPKPPLRYTPQPPKPHADYVAQKIDAERLPSGFTKISGRKYILRPEAIESVFYLYRITGDPYFRDMGWQMFTAIDSHTRALYGNSAIDDVTKSAPEPIDSMESFWTAETLKYFYLLFDEPGTWTLDEWVLNTEAHFFRRPS